MDDKIVVAVEDIVCATLGRVGVMVVAVVLRLNSSAVVTIGDLVSLSSRCEVFNKSVNLVKIGS